MEKAFPFHKILEDTFEDRVRRGEHFVHPRAEKIAELLFRQHLQMFFEKLDKTNKICIEEELKTQKELDCQKSVQSERYSRRLSSTPISSPSKKPKAEISNESLGYDSFAKDEKDAVLDIGKLDINSSSMGEKSTLRGESNHAFQYDAWENDDTYVEMNFGNNAAGKTEELSFHRGSYMPEIHLDDYEMIDIDLQSNQSVDDGSKPKKPKSKFIEFLRKKLSLSCVT